MKVIFLDFDGVLNSWRWYKNLALAGRKPSMRPDDQIDPKAVSVLNTIIEKTGAKVVVSSTWRIARSVEQLQEILTKYGFAGQVIGKTPRLGGPRPQRGDEIQVWLDENPGVERFVIIDDDSDMVHLMNRLVRTDMKKGLTKAHAEEVVKLLSL
jgi:hypothetical protein